MKPEKTDFGYKQVDLQEKQKLVNRVFDSVADRYDLMNDLMSLGIHRWWKRQAISTCQLRPGQQVLDLAAGTGDLTRLIAPKVTRSGSVTLCDLNHAMLLNGRKQLIDQGLVENIQIVQGNAQALPFADNSFDRLIIGFGLRNVTHKEQALSSMYRVLKPGGRLIILEFSRPTSQKFNYLYDAYSFHILPRLGEFIANDRESYQYLVESIRMHPDQETLKTMMETAGFEKCTYQNLTFGVVAIHKGLKY